MGEHAQISETLGNTVPMLIETDIIEDLNFIQHRVFINQVDTFNVRHIASYLTDQYYGARKVGDDMEEMEGEMEPEESNLEEQSQPPLTTKISEKYEIVGTLQKSFHKPSEDIHMVIDESPREEFIANILKCGFVVFDITHDPGEIPKALAALNDIIAQIEKPKEIGPKTFAASGPLRIFVLISTVLTWAKSKPIDPDEPDTPFTEADYKKRRPHPNYKEHITCEREVILKGRTYKDKLRTYVIASGIIYGHEENDLGSIFKMAWRNQDLPLFNSGKNTVPFIHVTDLAKVLHALLEMTPKKPQYMLAIEQTPTKFNKVVKSLSKLMGTRKVVNVPREEAFLYSDISQKVYERINVNINMEPSFIVETLAIEWKNEMNLSENMRKIVEEFRKALELTPIKIIMHGPPASGKTRVAQMLCRTYGLHYVNPPIAIEAACTDIKAKIDLVNSKNAKENEEEEAAAEEEEEAEAEEEEELPDIEELIEQLRDIETTMEQVGKLPDEYITRFIKEYILKNACLNQGYILDGWPKTTAQTKELFGGDGEDEGEGEEEEDEGEEAEEGGGAGGLSQRQKLLPTYIFSLEATDEFLCERIMQLPEEDIQGTHYEEEEMLRRLQVFRQNNTEDNTPLNYFDDIEIHPLIINIMEDETETMDQVMTIITERLGKPIGFGLTPEEEEEMIRFEEERQLLLEQEQRLKEEMLRQEAEEERKRKMEEWADLLEELQMEEEKILVAEGEPLRHYLMKFVFPTLCKGLLEVARLRPSDPVDFLAEFLFQTNPEGRMFNPAYTRAGKRMSDAFAEDAEKKIC